MSSPRQTIAFDDTTKRIRVAFTKPFGKNAKRYDVWVNSSDVGSSTSQEPNVDLFLGPNADDNALRSKNIIDRTTFVEEIAMLGSARVGLGHRDADPSDMDIDELPSATMNDTGKDAPSENDEDVPSENDEDAQSEDDEGTQSENDEDVPSESARGVPSESDEDAETDTGEDAGSGTERESSSTTDPAEMTDDQIVELFFDDQKPVTNFAVARMAVVVMNEQNLSEVPPCALLRSLRLKIPTCDDIWALPEWRDWEYITRHGNDNPRQSWVPAMKITVEVSLPRGTVED